MQFFLEVEQLLLLALEHFGDGYARPARNYFGNVVAVDFLLDERLVALHFTQAVLDLMVLVLLLLDEGVPDFSNTAVVAVAFGSFRIKIELFDVDFVLLNLVDELLLALPLGVVVVFAVLEFGNLLVQVGDACFVSIAFDGGALDFELRNLT